MCVIGSLYKVILSAHGCAFVHIKDSVSYFNMYSLQAGWPEVRIPARARNFHSPKSPDLPRGPPKLLFIWYWGTFMGVKQSGREADCSPPPNSAEVKNE